MAGSARGLESVLTDTPFEFQVDTTLLYVRENESLKRVLAVSLVAPPIYTTGKSNSAARAFLCTGTDKIADVLVLADGEVQVELLPFELKSIRVELE